MSLRPISFRSSIDTDGGSAPLDDAGSSTASPLKTPSSPSRLRLLVQHLTDADLARIAAFLRVGSARLQCTWELVVEGPSDLLLSGREAPRGTPGTLPTLTVIDAQPGRPAGRHALVRPLQYDAFVDMLCAREVRLLRTPPIPSAVTYAVAQPLGEVTPALLPSLLPGARCRLRRWPPSAVLQAHHHHRTLASFLSSRHLDLDELARLSNVERTLCEEFAVTLVTLGVLDVQPASAFTPLRSAAAPIAASPAPAGLVTRLRRRLGLGGHGG